MTDHQADRLTLDITAIQQAEFCPPPPSRHDAPHALPEEVRQLMRSAHQQEIAGFFTEAAADSRHRYLTVLLSSSRSNERAIAVFDTLTHMHKQDLTPFTLSRHTIEGREMHYGRFLVDAELRCTLESIRTSAQEIAELTNRSQWKKFFDQARSLYALDSPQSQRRGVAIVEPRPLDILSDQGAAPQPTTALLPGLSEEHEVHAQLYTPDRSPEKLLIVCDGHTYSHRYPLWPAIEHLNRSALKSAPCAVLLLEPAGALSREHFLGSEDYLSRWLASTAFSWVEHQMPLPTANNCLIVGGSLGGLAAAQTVKNIPHLVSKAVVQSGAFWWHAPDDDSAEGQALQDWLTEPLPTEIEIFHEVGSNEGYLLSWNLAFHKILTERAVNHAHRVYSGGHDYACWRQGVVDALTYFFASTTASA